MYYIGKLTWDEMEMSYKRSIISVDGSDMIFPWSFA